MTKKKTEKTAEEKKKPVKAEKKENADDFWTDELVEDEQAEEVDLKKLKFAKIKELKLGMEGVNVTAKIDFIGNTGGKEYGDEPYAVGFIRDETGEVKLTFWGDDIKKAKKGKPIRVINGYVSEYKGQLQLNPDRARGIEFI
jgi:ssDNA-binding replication factor A large subunit